MHSVTRVPVVCACLSSFWMCSWEAVIFFVYLCLYRIVCLRVCVYVCV